METVEKESKDVTIRNVDTELYDQFSTYAKKEGLTTGELFNILFSGFIDQNISPLRLVRRRTHRIKSHERPEVISDMDELTISRKDLEVLKGKKTFFFIRINNLVFNEDVDGKLLSETIHAIGKCDNVQFKGDVPKLVELGLVIKKGSYIYPSDSEKLKDITIRKVSKEVYDAFLAKSKEEEKTTGELFSETLAFYLPTFEIFEYVRIIERETRTYPLIVRDIEELTVFNKDLEQISPKKVLFYRIKKLTFEKEVSVQNFEKSIGKIIKCRQVFIPEEIPKLLALARTTEGCETYLGKEKIRCY
ncbi:MAG: hypothetical protein ACTSVB_06180 [Candidatus Heimdallarchaeaceae archaeon]